MRRTSLVEQQSDLDSSACSTEHELGEADAVLPQNLRFLAKAKEARCLAGVLTIVERGNLSYNRTKKLIADPALTPQFSLDVIRSHVLSYTGVTPRVKVLCPTGHAAVGGGRAIATKCLDASCKQKVGNGN